MTKLIEKNTTIPTNAAQVFLLPPRTIKPPSPFMYYKVNVKKQRLINRWAF